MSPAKHLPLEKFEAVDMPFHDSICQYALRERARALAWADERIVVIDQDLGHSGGVSKFQGIGLLFILD